MRQLFHEALTMIEGDIKWLRDAAQHCQAYASKLPAPDREGAALLFAVYLERAKAHEELAAKMKKESVVR